MPRAFFLHAMLVSSHVMRVSSALSVVCKDTPGWDNRSGKSCTDYHMERWCSHGAFTTGREWTGGAQFNYPERACCVCGKQAALAPSVEDQLATAAAAKSERDDVAEKEAKEPPEAREELQRRM